MRKNKLKKRQIENNCGLRLRELCEVLHPPKYRRKDFQIGLTISEVAECVGNLPNFVWNEIKEKRLTAVAVNGKVRVLTDSFVNWLAMD